MDAAPRVEVLLLNWNGWRDTIECLERVFALEYPNFGVIVCDNGSTDGSTEHILKWAEGILDVERPSGAPSPIRPVGGLARPARAIVLDGPTAETGSQADSEADLVIIRTGGNLGFAGGNNVGLRHIMARGLAKYVWLLNNDTVVSPDALTQLVEHAERNPSQAAIGATVLEFDEPERVQYLAGASISPWRGRIQLYGRGLHASAPRPQPKSLHYVSGACMLVPVRILYQVGLLDDRFFMYSEDADWGCRMRQEGHELGFAPNAVIWHKGGASWSRGSPLQDYHHLLGTLLVMRRHYPSHMPITVFWALVRFLAPRIVRGEWDRAAAVLQAFRDFARGAARSHLSGQVSDRQRATTLSQPLSSVDAP